MEIIHKPKGCYADYVSGNYSNKLFVFELVKRNSEGGTMRDKATQRTIAYPLSKLIKMTGSISFKDSSGRTYPRMIRYAQGENKIFVDEQSPDDKIPKKPVFAEFVRGRFQVDGQNATLLDFVMKWDMNESNTSRDPKKVAMFRLVDNSKIAQKAQEKDDLEFDAILWCRKGDWDTKVRPLASMIFSSEQMMQPVSEIRYNLVQIAKKDPASFMRFIDDPKTIRTIVLRAAIENGIVEVDTSLNALFWTDNKNAPISQALPGKDAVADYVAKSFSSEGERVYKEIEKLVNGEPEVVIPTQQVYVAKTAQVNAPMVKGSTDTDEEILTLIRLGVEKGAVVIGGNNMWWKYRDINGKKEEGLMLKLRDNEILLQALKQDVFG